MKKDYINAIPNELKMQIFSYLNLIDLNSMSKVSKLYFMLASDDFLWKKFFNDFFINVAPSCKRVGENAFESFKITFKNVLKTQPEIKKRLCFVAAFAGQKECKMLISKFKVKPRTLLCDVLYFNELTSPLRWAQIGKNQPVLNQFYQLFLASELDTADISDSFFKRKNTYDNSVHAKIIMAILCHQPPAIILKLFANLGLTINDQLPLIDGFPLEIFLEMNILQWAIFSDHTPLAIVILTGAYKEIINQVKETIIEIKLDIQKKCLKGTPLLMALERNNTEIYELLLSMKANLFPDFELNAIDIACKQGNYELMQRFLMEEQLSLISLEKVLGYAAQSGNLELVKLLIERDENIIKEHGDLVLENAASSGNLSLVKYLIDQGAVVTKKKSVVLLNAILTGNLQLVDYLSTIPVIQETLYLTAESIDYSPIRFACIQGELEIVKFLLQNKSLKFNTKEILFDIAISGNVKLLNYIFNEPIFLRAWQEDIELQEKMLTHLCYEGYYEAAKELIDRGAVLNVSDINLFCKESICRDGKREENKYLIEQLLKSTLFSDNTQKCVMQ